MTNYIKSIQLFILSGVIGLLPFAKALADINLTNSVVDQYGNSSGMFVACGNSPKAWSTPWMGPLDNPGDIGGCSSNFKYAFITFCPLSSVSCPMLVSPYVPGMAIYDGYNVVRFQAKKVTTNYKITTGTTKFVGNQTPIKVMPQ